MANTTNIDLVKPAGTDHALVSVLNANSDKIDAEAGNVRSNFALVQNTNTATQAISKDQLVVWKGVLKKATSNIANGATLSNSNLTDTKVSTELASLSDHIGTYGNRSQPTVGSAYTSNVTTNSVYFVKRNDGLCIVSGTFVLGTAISGGAEQNLFEGLPTYKNTYSLDWVLIAGEDGKTYRLQFKSGYLSQNYTSYPAQKYYILPFMYFAS